MEQELEEETLSENQHTFFMEKGLKELVHMLQLPFPPILQAELLVVSLVLKGPNTTISAGCNSGFDASYLAYNAIRIGDADLMIVGAGEAPITPYIFAIFCASGFLSREIGNRERP